MCAAFSSLNLVLLGPPEAGVGDQAQRLARTFLLPHVSAKELLRAEAESGIGRSRGCADTASTDDRTGDAVLRSTLFERLHREDCARGFILEGYPRTLEQVATFDVVLAELGRGIERVVLLDPAGGNGSSPTAEAALEGPRGTDPVRELYRERGQLLEVDAGQPPKAVNEAILRAIAVPVGA